MSLRVVELFAGIGGFRLGLDQAGGFETVWSNQWEPETKAQHAYDVLRRRFAGKVDNRDIRTVPVEDIPEHDVLAGGFPCQDYSVARANSPGVDGEKGSLWFEVDRILRHRRPKVLLLENVDRLLVSPGADKYRGDRRGRDLGVILACLMDNGYVVTWRVVNSGAAATKCRERHGAREAVPGRP